MQAEFGKMNQLLSVKTFQCTYLRAVLFGWQQSLLTRARWWRTTILRRTIRSCQPPRSRRQGFLPVLLPVRQPLVWTLLRPHYGQSVFLTLFLSSGTILFSSQDSLTLTTSTLGAKAPDGFALAHFGTILTTVINNTGKMHFPGGQTP